MAISSLEYKAVINKLGVTAIPRHITLVAHAEPNVEQQNQNAFATAFVLGYHIA